MQKLSGRASIWQKVEPAAPPVEEKRKVAVFERVVGRGLPVSRMVAGTSNVAVTFLAASMVSEQSLRPVQPSPDHPINAEPGAAAADRVTEAPVR